MAATSSDEYRHGDAVTPQMFGDRSDETLPAGFDRIGKTAQGSFSEIWKVRESSTGCLFALKCLLGDWNDDIAAMQLLRNEARIGQSVDSRYVVRFEQSGAGCEGPWNLLEWLDGETLERRLRGNRRLSVGEAVWIARQCTQGLCDLAEAGFSHGDVKPANIFLTGDGNVKLIDLGFARSFQEPHTIENTQYLTGTAAYMAPETLTRGSVNPLTRDMYSLGIMLFRMLSGRLPFETANSDSALRLHRSARPPQLESRCRAAPPELIRLIKQLLAKQPIRRPQSYQTLLRMLLRLELATLPLRFAA